MVNDLTVLWENYWITCPNEMKKRVLLIGDSVFRQVRSSLEYMLNECYVDFYATSYSISDESYFEGISAFLENLPVEVKYDTIMYMENHHSYDFCYKREEKKYSERVIQIANICSEYCDCFKYISISLFNPQGQKKIWNDEVIERNNFAKEIMQERFVDLNDTLREIPYSDEVHFSDKYNYVIADLLAKAGGYCGGWKRIPLLIKDILDLDFVDVYIFGICDESQTMGWFLQHLCGKRILAFVTSAEYRSYITGGNR